MIFIGKEKFEDEENNISKEENVYTDNDQFGESLDQTNDIDIGQNEQTNVDSED